MSGKRLFPRFRHGYRVGVVMERRGSGWVHGSTIICCSISLDLMAATLIPLINVCRGNEISANGSPQSPKVFDRNFHYLMYSINTNFLQLRVRYDFPQFRMKDVRITPYSSVGKFLQNLGRVVCRISREPITTGKETKKGRR